MKIAPAALIPFIFSGTATADIDLTFLNLPKAGAVETVLLLATVTLFAGSLAVMGVWSFRRQREREEKAGKMRFTVNCRRFNLDETEEWKLREMISATGTADPNTVFESMQLFEQCVDREITGVLQEAPPEDWQATEDLIASIRAKLRYRTMDEAAPLVSTRNIQPGQRVSLVMHRCEASVALIKELFFTLKIDRESMPVVAPGTLLRLVFARKSDALYGADVTVVSSENSGVIRCRHTNLLKRNQVRQDVRLGINSIIRLRMHHPADQSTPQSTRGPFDARMLDISGGGVSFLSETEYAAGDLLFLESSGPAVPASGVLLKILAISEPPGKNPKGKRYHAQFINIGFEKREKIVRYVFEKLRELNKR